MARLVGCMLAAAIAAAPACSSTPAVSYPQKLVVLGFDGMDPDLVERWMREGKLPTFAKLAADGGLHHLETTHSANPATAWASLATGVNPGKHRIFDVIDREAGTYVPRLSLVDRQPGRVLFDYLRVAQPRTTPRRAGTSFWTAAGIAGVRSTIVGVPLTFPPENVPNGRILSGFPLPDLAGTMGTYHYFATDVSAPAETHTDGGGVVRKLVFQARRAEVELIGPRDPFSAESNQHVRLPLAITWNHDDRSVNVEIGNQNVHLLERQWSRWVEVEFRLNFMTRVYGMVQFYLANAGQHLQLYVSPVHWSAAHPPEPMSSPASFADDLHDRLGHYRTLGWPASVWALSEGHLDEAAFVQDVEREFTDRAETILNRIDARDWDLLVGVIDATDRVQHAMWRAIDPRDRNEHPHPARAHGDAIERMYRRADEFTAELIEHLDPGAALMIVSAYGFQPFHTDVHLNSWLVERGYMTLRGRVAPRRAAHELTGASSFWENVDWSRTRAYAVGFGQVFVNLSGREAQGVVRPGAESDRLLDTLLIDLMNFHDERTYDRVVANVYKGAEIYDGPFAAEGGDLLVALEPGYRISWQTALGGTPPTSLAPNTDQWSGDHTSMDHRTVAGLLLTNRPLAAPAPRVFDIAPTVLRYFGVQLPADLDGVPLY